jgi:precorrin-2 dehydrogenase/sirohydrochlorin ferrochelatase
MKYPIFLELADRRVVVVGAGTVAYRKAQKLLEAGARVAIVAEHFDQALDVLVQQNSKAELVKAPYSAEYLAEATLCVAATNNPAVNKQVYADCQKRNILCNVVDAPELCDWFAPASFSRGGLTIAIGTQGYAPAFAGHIRRKLEGIITEIHGEFLSELEKMRARVLAEVHDAADRKAIMGRLADDESMEYFIARGEDKWRHYADEIMHKLESSTQS